MSKEIEIPDLDHLIRRYESGVSMKKLAEESGFGYKVLRRRLRLRGVHIRGRSEAELLKWRRLKPDRAAIERQCSAAWSARRGSTDPLERKIARAKTRYERLTHTSPNEHALAVELRRRGLRFALQHPVGYYNLDLALKRLRVAVEVETARSDRCGALSRKRAEYLLDRRWSLIVVTLAAPDPTRGWSRERERLPSGTFAPEGGRSPDPGFDFPAIADKLVAFVESMGGLPSMSGQYGVIGREAQPVPVARRYLARWPRIKGF